MCLFIAVLTRRLALKPTRLSSVQADFDLIAEARSGRWNHNNHYHQFILKHLPARRGTVLDIGCGTGDLAAILATLFDSVVAIDFSHGMIQRARERLRNTTNVQLVERDVQTFAFAPSSFDMIVSIATFHHLPFRSEVLRLKPALARGGSLIILDLCKPSTLTDFIFAGLAFPASLLLEAIHNKGNRRSAKEKLAWKQHGKNDVYAPISEIRAIAGELLPGAKVRRLLFWRYCLIWKNE